MIEIVQAGQAGKTALLFEMHRLRKRVFKDRMKWDVHITDGGLEVDQFDLPNAVYLLATNKAGRVVGNWRLLPTTGPTMIRDVWPGFLDSLPMPSSATVWEASRFAVDSPDGQSKEGLAEVNRATQELFCGLTEVCLLAGVREVYTLYDMRIARLLKRLDCRARATSQRLRIDNFLAETGVFTTDETMLANLRAATGIREQLVQPDMLPPILAELRAKSQPRAQFPWKRPLEMADSEAGTGADQRKACKG
jgi:N-acyl-L-homoserine lactone synthetase